MIANTFLKEILFSTVRIVAGESQSPSTALSIGTGFLVTKSIDDVTARIYLITNKHVVARTNDNGKVIGKFQSGFFSFLKGDGDNPKLGDSFPVHMSNFTDQFLLHPDETVDLAICNISNIYNTITINLNQNLFIKGIPIEFITSNKETFDAIEDVIFVGYPNGIFDEKNHLPIIRKGITASPFEVDFNGGRKFLIDAQVFPGSSGSPVFIKQSNFRNGAIVLSGKEYLLAGIISKVFHRTETGKVTPQIIPTNDLGEVTMRQMIGLGICEKSNQIIDLINMLDR